ncbi:hypothetical protein RS130_05690 [Paraglaciecola aquimarina]|uniref:Secreted protein n=1 Tax=Paraglaciecola aquimarina TaxID=1235557 RepID=A0ABU3SU05_9ALTE|nr:hypothetical protein [Paraglaciecola aquimarina]MDU0353483.1 hypothetical protein [Paraglaciecola aquimarina]
MSLFCRLSMGLLVLVTFEVMSMPAQCIQAPERAQLCPHTIYKKAALAIPQLGIKQNQVICLCLTDLQGLQNKAKTKLEQIDQQVTLQRTARKYSLSQEQIKTLLNH